MLSHPVPSNLACHNRYLKICAEHPHSHERIILDGIECKYTSIIGLYSRPDQKVDMFFLGLRLDAGRTLEYTKRASVKRKQSRLGLHLQKIRGILPMTRDSAKGSRLVALFLLGCLLMNYPILSLFNIDKLFFGIPVLYCHLFLSWFMLIAVTAWIAKTKADEASQETQSLH
jgi:hypothetical protein